MTHAKFAVVHNRLLVILLDIVREVVNRNRVVLDVLHHSLLESVKLVRGEGVRLADDGDDVDAGGEAAHELDVEFAETVRESKGESGENGKRREWRKKGGGTNAWPVGVMK